MKFHVSLFVLLAGLMLSSCHRGVYTATAAITITLQYSDDRENPVQSIPEQIQNEIEVIESPDILKPVIKDLNLDRIWAQRFKTGGDTLSMDDALKHLQQVLRVEPGPMATNGASSTFKITAYSEVPREAADIANAIADRYKAMRDTAEKSLLTSGIAVLRNQIMLQEQAVNEDQAKATQNPQDSDLQKQSQVSRNMLQALRIKLQQDEADIKLQTSPVTIISRAVPPPE